MLLSEVDNDEKQIVSLVSWLNGNSDEMPKLPWPLAQKVFLTASSPKFEKRRTRDRSFGQRYRLLGESLDDNKNDLHNQAREAFAQTTIEPVTHTNRKQSRHQGRVFRR